MESENLLPGFRLSRRHGTFAIAAFTLLVAFSYLVLDRLAPGGRRLAKIAGEDTVGYFGITHSLLFDHDFNLNNEYARLPPANRELTPNQKVSGLPSSHWPIGYSLLQIPFLAAGTLLDYLAGNPADGYARFALYGYGLGNIFLTGIGLFFLFRFLCSVGHIWDINDSRKTACALFVTFAAFFGSNIGYYSFAQLSHASTALFSSIFLYYWWKIRSTTDGGKWLLLGFAGGYLSICRWQDGVILLAPLLFDLMGPEWRTKPWPWLRSRFMLVAGVAVCWIPQLIELKIIYGKYLTNPYQEMTSTFPPQFVFKVLISSQNGWMLWTPLIVFGLVGLGYGAYRFSRIYMPWILIVALEVLLIGSLNAWHGTDSFSSRFLTSMVPIVSLGVFTLLCAFTGPPRRILMGAIVVCCLFSTFFAFQLRFNLIPSAQTLTAKEVFLDKFYLARVREQKVAAGQARALLAAGHPEAAIRTLENATSLGDDRDVLVALAKAYRVEGDEIRAEDLDRRVKQYLDTRLY